MLLLKATHLTSPPHTFHLVNTGYPVQGKNLIVRGWILWGGPPPCLLISGLTLLCDGLSGGH